MLGDFGQIDIRTKGHGTRVNLQDLKPSLSIGNTDLNLSIEPARATERWIQHLGNIGGAHDDDLAAGQEAIHQTQELSHDPLFDFTGHLGAFGRDGVNLVDEENRRRSTRRLLEDLSKLGLAFP